MPISIGEYWGCRFEGTVEKYGRFVPHVQKLGQVVCFASRHYIDSLVETAAAGKLSRAIGLNFERICVKLHPCDWNSACFDKPGKDCFFEKNHENVALDWQMWKFDRAYNRVFAYSYEQFWIFQASKIINSFLQKAFKREGSLRIFDKKAYAWNCFGFHKQL